MIGRIQKLALNWQTRRPEVTLELDITPEELEKYQGKKLSVEIKTYRERRSLDANAYYWTLAGKLAAVLKQSTGWVHNFLIRRYGQPEEIGGKAVYVTIPDTDEAAKAVDEETLYHLRPTSQVRQGNDGVMYRTYRLMRGSHEYNTAEMTGLINGLVMECRESGIETMTPDELTKMMAAYEARRNHDKRG